MNKTLKAALAALLVAGSASGARADLNINGAVGLPLNPTAQIPDPGGVHIQGNYYDKAGGGTSEVYGVVGAMRIGEQIEVNGGALRLNNAGGLSKTGLAIGGKYLFTRATDPAAVRIAAGAGYSRALIRNTHVYVVGTKSLAGLFNLQQNLTGHLGLRYDRFKAFGSSSKVSVYAGAEVPLSATGELSAVAEVQSKNIDGGDPPYSAGLRYRVPGKRYFVSAGVARPFDKAGFFVQLGTSFGTGFFSGTGVGE